MKKEIPPAPTKGKFWYTMLFVETKEQYLCENDKGGECFLLKKEALPVPHKEKP